jgi:hypothetical protein
MKKILVSTLILILGVFLLTAPRIKAQDFCEGDFNYNGSVAAEDVEVFLEHFGRSPFNNPCPPDGPAPVEKTWQWISYATGDDGDHEHGAMWPNPRFTDNLDGTITDNLTGLIWLKDANCFGQRIWNDALSDCNGLSAGYCDLTDGSSVGDWRPPNLKELQSLIHYGFYDPALPCTAGPCHWTGGDPFINVQSGYYWSSTTSAGNTDYAWDVGMYNGYVSFSSKSNSNYVWPVRGGQ